MLPSSGEINTAQIVDEFGFPSKMMDLNKRRNPATNLIEVWIDGGWRVCNPCNGFEIPTTPPHNVTDFYGYNHAATGITGGTITGSLNVEKGSTHTYGVSLTGGNTTGNLTYTWFKFENNVWSAAIGTASTVSITWSNPIGAKVKVNIGGGCQGTFVTLDANITPICVAPTTVVNYCENSLQEGTVFTAYAINPTGSDLMRSYQWTAFGPIQLLGSQGNAGMQVKATGPGNAVLRLQLTNYCGSSSFADVSITITAAPPNVYWNTYQEKNVVKNDCANNQYGSTVVVSVPPNTFSGSSVAEANGKAQDYLNSSAAQQKANEQGTCTLTPVFPSTYRKDTIQKNNCSSGHGTYVEVEANGGMFVSETSVSHANALRDAWMQQQANAQGTCNTNACNFIINSVSTSGTSNTSPTQANDVVTLGTATINVSSAGNYTVTVNIIGSTVFSQTFDLAAGNNTINLGSADVGNMFNAGMPNGGQMSGTIDIFVSSSCHYKGLEGPSVIYTYNVGQSGFSWSGISVSVVSNSFQSLITINNSTGTDIRYRYRMQSSYSFSFTPWSGYFNSVQSTTNMAALFPVGATIEVQMETNTGQSTTFYATVGASG